MPDAKISALTELTSPDASDLLAIVDDPAGTPVTKKITLTNLLAGKQDVLTGLTSSVTELNYTDGVTSAIQTQLDAMVEKAGDTMTGALNVNSQHILALSGEVVFNETAADIDFRIESDTVTNAFILDGATGSIGLSRDIVAGKVLAVGGTSDFYDELNMVITGENAGAFKAYKAGESSARFQFTDHGDMQWGGGSGAADTTLIRRASNRIQTYGDMHLGDYSAPTLKLNGVTGYIGIKDGVTAPSAETGFARIYVDTADGDLKVKFADGHVAVIAADS